MLLPSVLINIITIATNELVVFHFGTKYCLNLCEVMHINTQHHFVHLFRLFVHKVIILVLSTHSLPMNLLVTMVTRAINLLIPIPQAEILKGLGEIFSFTE